MATTAMTLGVGQATPHFPRTLAASMSSMRASCWTDASFRDNWIWMYRSWPFILHVDWRETWTNGPNGCWAAGSPQHQKTKALWCWAGHFQCLFQENDTYSYSWVREHSYNDFWLATGWWRTEPMAGPHRRHFFCVGEFCFLMKWFPHYIPSYLIRAPFSLKHRHFWVCSVPLNHPTIFVVNPMP